jgi:hypothetical protein
MSPTDLDKLAPLIAFLVVSFICSIPVIAFSARFAIKPMVEALARLRESSGHDSSVDRALAQQDRRLSLMEAELQHVTAALDRLAEAERFHAQLAAPAPRSPAALRSPEPGLD